MRTFRFALILPFLVCALPACAQNALVKGGVRLLQKETQTALQKAGAVRAAAFGSANAAAQKTAIVLPPSYTEKLRQAALKSAQNAQAHKESFEKLLAHGLFTVTGTEAATPATGFVIAEEYRGKTVLWGVVSRHVLRMTGPAPVITFKPYDQSFSYQAFARVLGSKRGADIALLELPPEAYDVARPLPLRTQPVQPGDETFSVGFAGGSLARLENRTVLVQTPLRVITPYRLQNVERDGYCGSPLFDAHGRVAAVHCGSYFPLQRHSHWYGPLQDKNPRLAAELAQHSQAVPVSWVQTLLDQYRGRPAKRALKLHGKTVAEIGADEAVSTIYIFRDGFVIHSLTPDPLLDYNHLENFLPLQPGDRVALDVVKESAGSFRPPVRYNLND